MDLDIGETRLLIETGRRFGLLRNQLAYVLATAYHETAHTMLPVREALASSDEQAIARLDSSWKKGRLPWVTKPYWRDGWFGRGFVQLTHDYNYQKASVNLDLDLLANPALALESDISALITVRGMIEGWFTGHKLADYITLKASNFVGARKIVNGTDRARAIAEHARDYDDALMAMGYGREKPVPIANDRRDGSAPRKSPLQTKTVVAASVIAATSVVGFSPEVTKALTELAGAIGLPDVHIEPAITILSVLVILAERIRKWVREDDR